jgi:2-polyprenyl-3-methyl-5-hydroxy-6-metoxy-1,4-benzoquinol methylase
MTKSTRTLAPAYFDAVYAADPDPWRFASSPYEKDKYAATMEALPKPVYVSAFEVGCSIGVLTRELASRCGNLLAVDVAPAPLAAAMSRCAHLPTVRFEQMFVPERWPDGVFDLIIFSEIIYYLGKLDVARLARNAARALSPHGDILLVHWTEETDYPLGGDEASELFIKLIAPAAKVVRQERRQSFRIDVLSRGQLTSL